MTLYIVIDAVHVSEINPLKDLAEIYVYFIMRVTLKKSCTV